MKTLLCVTLLLATYVLPAAVYAVSHLNGETAEAWQPRSTFYLVVASSVFFGRENLPTLLQKLEDPDPFVRVEAVQGLGEIPLEQALVSVCGCLDDENLYVRAYAAEALGKIGHVDMGFTLSRLLPALGDPSPYVKAMMLAALGELQDERASEAIKEYLHDEDQSVRKMAAWALKEIENSQ